MSQHRVTLAVGRDVSVLDEVAVAGDFATPFQSPLWLKTWYDAFCTAPGTEPLIVLAMDGDGSPRLQRDRCICALPLIRRRRYGLPLVEWADRGVTDYNLPLAGPAFEKAGPGLFPALARRVRPYARLALRKMPPSLRGPDHPLLMRAPASPDPLSAYHLFLPRDTEAFDRQLGAKKMRDIRRGRRLLEAAGQAPVFRLAHDADERRVVFDMVRRSQTARHGGTGRYLLDEPPYTDFYETLVTAPATQALVRLAALWMNDTPVAGLVALTDRRGCVVTRLGMSDVPEIAQAGPGKLLLYEMARWAIAAGYPMLDLSIGSNPLKTWFHCTPQPLVMVNRYANGCL